MTGDTRRRVRWRTPDGKAHSSVCPTPELARSFAAEVGGVIVEPRPAGRAPAERQAGEPEPRPAREPARSAFVEGLISPWQM